MSETSSTGTSNMNASQITQTPSKRLAQKSLIQIGDRIWYITPTEHISSIIVDAFKVNHSEDENPDKDYITEYVGHKPTLFTKDPVTHANTLVVTGEEAIETDLVALKRRDGLCGVPIRNAYRSFSAAKDELLRMILETYQETEAMKDGDEFM